MSVNVAVPTQGVFQIKGAVIACTISGGIVTPISAGGGSNPFDQNLNTNNDVEFNSVSISGLLVVSATQINHAGLSAKLSQGGFLWDKNGNEFSDGLRIGDIINGSWFDFSDGSLHVGTELVVDSSQNITANTVASNEFDGRGSGIILNDNTIVQGSISVSSLSNGGIIAADGAGGLNIAVASDILSALSVIPIADGTYTVGLGVTNNGTITTVNGLITAIQEAS